MTIFCSHLLTRRVSSTHRKEGIEDNEKTLLSLLSHLDRTDKAQLFFGLHLAAEAGCICREQFLLPLLIFFSDALGNTDSSIVDLTLAQVSRFYIL
jgi:hypothetical protein